MALFLPETSSALEERTILIPVMVIISAVVMSMMLG